jgi:integrase
MHRGKLFQESTRLTNSKAALRLAHHRRTELISEAAGVPADTPRTAGRVTLQTLATRYHEFHAGHFPRSYENARRAVNHFVRVTGGERDIRTITGADVEHFRAVRLSEQMARTSIRTETISVRALFRQSEAWYGTRSPWAVTVTQEGEKRRGVPAFQVDEEEVQVATPDEVRRTFAELPAPYNLFCAVTYYVLPRLSEVLTLRRDQVGVTVGRDGQATGFLVRRLKGGRQKRVGIPLWLAERLMAHVLTPEQEVLFPDHVNSDRVSGDLCRLFVRAGLPHLHHHVFRHTGITRMLDGGATPVSIMQLAGWTSLRQLTRYGHVSDAERDRAVMLNAVEFEPATPPTPPPPTPPARRKARKAVVA